MAVAAVSVAKIANRAARAVITGDGDHR